LTGITNAFSRKEGSGTNLRFGNELSEFSLHIHIKYTNEHSLRIKGVGTVFPLKKTLGIIDPLSALL